MCVDNFEAVLRETEREIGSWNLTKIDELVNFSDEQKLWTELCIKKCPIKVRGRRERERERQNSQDFNFPISTWKMEGQLTKVKKWMLKRLREIRFERNPEICSKKWTKNIYLHLYETPKLQVLFLGTSITRVLI